MPGTVLSVLCVLGYLVLPRTLWRADEKTAALKQGRELAQCLRASVKCRLPHPNPPSSRELYQPLIDQDWCLLMTTHSQMHGHMPHTAPFPSVSSRSFHLYCSGSSSDFHSLVHSKPSWGAGGPSLGLGAITEKCIWPTIKSFPEPPNHIIGK